MKKLKQYLNKVSQHLYKFEQNGVSTYQKVIVEGDSFTVIKFDENMDVISEKSYPMSRFASVSPAGKEYIPTELKNYYLFYKGSSYDPIKITTVPHFKKFREAFADYKNQLVMA